MVTFPRGAYTIPGTPLTSAMADRRDSAAADRAPRATSAAPSSTDGYPGGTAAASACSTTSGSSTASSAVRSPARDAARNASATACCLASRSPEAGIPAWRPRRRRPAPAAARGWPAAAPRPPNAR